jgi:hypothetical protein
MRFSASASVHHFAMPIAAIPVGLNNCETNHNKHKHDQALQEIFHRAIAGEGLCGGRLSLRPRVPSPGMALLWLATSA